MAASGNSRGGDAVRHDRKPRKMTRQLLMRSFPWVERRRKPGGGYAESYGVPRNNSKEL